MNIKHKITHLVLLTIAASLLLGSCMASAAESAKPEIKIEIASPNKALSVEGPIVLDMKITNIGRKRGGIGSDLRNTIEINRYRIFMASHSS